MTNNSTRIRVYIAGPWVDREKMPAIAQKVRDAGMNITHSWWLVEDTPEGERNLETLQGQAYADYSGVKNCDIMLLINSKKSEGKAVEQGIALADAKPIVAVGKRGEHSSNVFHYLPGFHWIEDIDEAIEKAKELGVTGVERRRFGQAK